jgi:hypothetical protein
MVAFSYLHCSFKRFAKRRFAAFRSAAWGRTNSATLSAKTKKTDAAKHTQVFRRIGLLFNEPPGTPSCSLCSHPNSAHSTACPLK